LVARPRGIFTATPLPGFFVDKHTVLAARNDPRVVVINALAPNSINGLESSRYGQVASREASMFRRRP
jgi:thiosulfate/3-mercaptopyruvate sulfurtransferase